MRAALRDAGHDVGVAGAVRAAGDLLLEAVEGLSDPHAAATAAGVKAAPRAPEAMLRHGALGRWVSLRSVLKHKNTPISPYFCRLIRAMSPPPSLTSFPTPPHEHATAAPPPPWPRPSAPPAPTSGREGSAPCGCC